MKAGDGKSVCIQVLFIDHLLSFKACADVDDLVVATRKQELYIIAAGADQTLQYYIYTCIKSQCLYSMQPQCLHNCSGFTIIFRLFRLV